MPTLYVSNLTELQNALQQVETNSSEQNPYTIIQTANISINMSATTFPQGVKRYMTYDGRGYSITSIYASNIGTYSTYVNSIFGQLENSIIKNVNWINQQFILYINSSSTPFASGVLAQTAKNTTFQNVDFFSNSVGSNVHAYIYGQYLGLLAGIMENCVVRGVKVTSQSSSGGLEFCAKISNPNDFTLIGGIAGLAVPPIVVEDVQVRFRIYSLTSNTLGIYIGGVFGAVLGYGGDVTLKRVVVENVSFESSLPSYTFDGVIGIVL